MSSWDTQQREVLEALGHAVYRTASPADAGGAAVAPADAASLPRLRAAAATPRAEAGARLALDGALRGDPPPGALRPRLRALPRAVRNACADHCARSPRPARQRRRQARAVAALRALRGRDGPR